MAVGVADDDLTVHRGSPGHAADAGCKDRRAYLGDVPEPVTYGVQGARERQGRYRGGGLGRDDDRG